MVAFGRGTSGARDFPLPFEEGCLRLSNIRRNWKRSSALRRVCASSGSKSKSSSSSASEMGCLRSGSCQLELRRLADLPRLLDAPAVGMIQRDRLRLRTWTDVPRCSRCCSNLPLPLPVPAPVCGPPAAVPDGGVPKLAVGLVGP